MVRLIDHFAQRGDISLFEDSKLAKDEGYRATEHAIRVIWEKLVETYGEGIEDLLEYYTIALRMREEFIYEYYFEQGFMVARR